MFTGDAWLGSDDVPLYWNNFGELCLLFISP